MAGIELFNVSCQVFCEKCPAGQYIDRSSYLQSCYACPAGKYADEEGTSECTDCPVGKAHNVTSADDPSTCADCRVGQYQDSPGSTACTSCDAGQYQSAVGKTYCDSCTVGWYQSQSGQSECARCPKHSGSCKLEIQVRPDPPLPPPPPPLKQSWLWAQDNQVKRVCKNQETSVDSCTCEPGYFLSADGKCKQCPEGAFCCMCEEIAGCYDERFGSCDLERLRKNMRRANSTCSGECVSGSPRPMPMYGFFRLDVSLDHERLDNSSALKMSDHPLWQSDLPARTVSAPSEDDEANVTSCCSWMKTAVTNESSSSIVRTTAQTWERDPEFAACNLKLPDAKLRTAVDPDYQGCQGGPSTECTEGSSGYLCRTCDEHHYMAFTGRCIKCGESCDSDDDDVECDPPVNGVCNPSNVTAQESCDYSYDKGTAAQWIQSLLFCLCFFGLIPVLFLGFFFSVSDKSATQMMVYPRLLVDLLIVFYLLYTSLFRYWPYDVVGYRIHDGHSRIEFLNNLFFECSFHWDFSTRYFAYLLLPFVLLASVLLQVGFVKFLKAYNDTESRLREVGDEADSGDFATPQISTGAARNGCLSGIARAIVAKLPNPNSARGARFALSPPQTDEAWEAWHDHVFQVLLLWLCLIYVTLVNYSLTVYDCSADNSHVEVLGKNYFLEEEANIACFTLDDPKWVKMLVGCIFATLFYTLGIPSTLVWVFYRKREEAMRGEIQYMRRYGFLLKPYKNQWYWWEIMNISRKALLSVMVKLNTHNPIICAALAMTVLFVIIATQAWARPYKYDKHNNCAICVYLTSLVNFFSSIVFISDLPSLWQKSILLYINLGLVAGVFVWTFGGAIKDIYNFARYFWFTFNCETNGRAEEERQVMWERVDLPGLISLVWYDMFVVRNRYSHTTTREEVLGKAADPAAEAAGQAAIDEDPLNMLATQSYLGEEYIVKRSAQTQHEAQAAFELFHKHFARYVSRIEEKAVSPNFLAEMRAEDAEQDARDRSESAERSRSAEGGATGDADADDEGEAGGDGAAAVSAEDLADAFLTQPEYDQSRMVKRAELLCEVYRKRTVRSQPCMVVHRSPFRIHPTCFKGVSWVS